MVAVEGVGSAYLENGAFFASEAPDFGADVLSLILHSESMIACCILYIPWKQNAVQDCCVLGDGSGPHTAGC